MTTVEFTELLNNRINKIQETLQKKGCEYASAMDRLRNFKIAAQINGTPTDISLWGMLTKHLASVMDIVGNEKVPPSEIVDEKLGDLINYLILLEAVWEDMRNDT